MAGAIDEPVLDEQLRHRLALIADSFLRLTGQPLLDDPTPERLWNAPRVIVAHGSEADPVFFYGNRLALEVFAMDFAAFTRLPSRYSAEPLEREERARLLERVSRDGFIDDYAGVRISASGQRFRIEQAVVWNLIDEKGACHGQAATFDRWQMIHAGLSSRNIAQSNPRD
ncbi:MAG: MEKHLA domain-containing protein [Propionivibrio sp.]|uniref:MEKHLA domain-containing protein n=1 Tax=Candidatus Propionivibrio dominans TaxID=2954373 RepID=A0A9D7IAP0_9RHOO|nr:MEKHLA domain-containing protein [Candidatus Propionivibrio dominans]MBL0167204.1 MEKHLA domain-containing protein [Propionivibrio sp.]